MKKYQGAFIKNEREIACLREANRMVANILDAIGDIVKPGETTMRFEELARDMCADYKVKPAFLGYYGYPYATCCSVNEQVVHGFPSPRLLEEGDIVSVDMGVVFEGFVGDAARTFPVGKVSEEACKLMRVTEASMSASSRRVPVTMSMPSVWPCKTMWKPPVSMSCVSMWATELAPRCTKSRKSPTITPVAAG